MSRGKQLIAEMKQHIIDQMRAESLCAPGAIGLGNFEIEALCDLALHLESHDQHFTHSLLRALIKNGIVERHCPASSRRPKYRLHDPLVEVDE